MYLRLDCPFTLIEIAQKLCNEATEDSVGLDFENVYEWMWVDLPDLDFSLNISREHGQPSIDINGLLDSVIEDAKEVSPTPGATYVMGWRRDIEDGYVDELPEWLPSRFADLLLVEVHLFNGRPDVDKPDGKPVLTVCPAGSG